MSQCILQYIYSLTAAENCLINTLTMKQTIKAVFPDTILCQHVIKLVMEAANRACNKLVLLD